MSESQTEKSDVIGFFKDLAIYLSRSPHSAITFLDSTIADLDEEVNRSSELNEEARATLKYLIGKLVESYRVFSDTYDKPVLRKFITEPENLTGLTQALSEILRAYRMLTTEDLSNGSSIIEDIAHSIETASSLIEDTVTTAISNLTEKLESSNCLQESQSS